MLIVKIGRTVKKLFKMGVLTNIAVLLPQNAILKNLIILFGSPCFAESISILLVKIGRTVQKLFKGEDFHKNCSLFSLK
jgi:hypothetical protein